MSQLSKFHLVSNKLKTYQRRIYVIYASLASILMRMTTIRTT